MGERHLGKGKGKIRPFSQAIRKAMRGAKTKDDVAALGRKTGKRIRQPLTVDFRSMDIQKNKEILLSKARQNSVGFFIERLGDFRGISPSGLLFGKEDEIRLGIAAQSFEIFMIT